MASAQRSRGLSIVVIEGLYRDYIGVKWGRSNIGLYRGYIGIIWGYIGFF